MSNSENKLKGLHWRVIFTAGMGFFTDAYDLFIIGVVTTLLSPIWHFQIWQLSLLNGASLLAAMFGAVFFGVLSDKFGRKRLYGIELLVLFVGAIMSALSPSFYWLLFARVLVGFGIGGDYPSSAVVASEYAPTTRRGYMVLLVFAMQAVGLVFGPALASLLLYSSLSHAVIWRYLLVFGALPAACVFYLRRRLQETPHFKRSRELPLNVSRAVKHLAKKNGKKKKIKPQSSLWQMKYMRRLIATAGCWFLLDVALYGNGVSSTLIMNALSPNDSLLQHTLITAAIFLVFAVPGYWAAARFVDQIGRRRLQIFGFVMITILYLIIGLVPQVINHIELFVLVYGLTFFFINFGPNATTFLVPAEIYPTSVRAKAHGISAAVGKLGAFIGVFGLPFLLQRYGVSYLMTIMGLVSLAGAALTLLLPEMTNVDLEALDKEV